MNTTKQNKNKVNYLTDSYAELNIADNEVIKRTMRNASLKLKSGRYSRSKEVAEKVLANVRAGKHSNMTKIQLEAGFTPKSAKALRATKTKIYQATVIPVLEGLKAIQLKAINNIISRDFEKEKLKDVNDSLKIVNHDVLLLEGKSTENIANRAVTTVVFGSDDFLAQQIANIEIQKANNNG